ncbi:hypothetical protein JTE90_022029 [Oedothorax gibbosus]|uniref:IRF tryptophan pentad repeat domain-containing protein n=1 Tax=Oedothorax gibbosus TaxID=931172 RepID=A0AAV6V1A1_9ARAC|nr:hypothetical protein JTE90_022029 [Oedothorax gibbosus]
MHGPSFSLHFTMPTRGQKFIEEFLKPNLNSRRFGTRLMWLNKELTKFQVQWNHKSASGWTKEDAEVFMAWDKIKGRYVPEDKDRFTKSKQRFRAIMYKLIKAGHISEIYCSEKFTKMYCFGSKENISSETNVVSTENKYTKFKSTPDLMYSNSNSDTYFNKSQIYENTNCEYSSNEDHKYANSKPSDLHVIIYQEKVNLSEKQVASSVMDYNYTGDTNDCFENHLNSYVKLEDIGNTTYEPSLEESLFSTGDFLQGLC